MMLNEVVVPFTFGLRYSFAFLARPWFSFPCSENFLGGPLLPSTQENGRLRRQEEVKERKRRKDLIHREIGGQSCEKQGRKEEQKRNPIRKEMNE